MDHHAGCKMLFEARINEVGLYKSFLPVNGIREGGIKPRSLLTVDGPGVHGSGIRVDPVDRDIGIGGYRDWQRSVGHRTCNVATKTYVAATKAFPDLSIIGIIITGIVEPIPAERNIVVWCIYGQIKLVPVGMVGGVIMLIQHVGSIAGIIVGSSGNYLNGYGFNNPGNNYAYYGKVKN